MTNDELDCRWRKILDWVADGCLDDLSDEEISARLQEAGIDMAPAYARLQTMIDDFRSNAAAESVGGTMSDGTASADDGDKGAYCDECGEFCYWSEFAETVEEYLCERCACEMPDECDDDDWEDDDDL